MKNIFLKISIGIFVVSFLVSNAYAESKNNLFCVTGEYWTASLTSDIKITDLGVIGTELDFIDDLGLDDSENITTLSGAIDLPFLPRIVVSYFDLSVDGSKNVTRTFNYKGKTYSVGTNLTSSLDVSCLEGYMEFMLLKQDFGELGVLLGARLFSVETQLTDNTTGITDSESVEGPVPIVGAQAEIQLPAKFRIGGILKGFSINYDSSEFKMYDIAAALHYDFNRFMRASAGYRYFLIDGKDDQNSAEVKFTGPYIGLTGSF
ncbi:MAG: hypothetical protein V1739_05670 [Candidatus Omnitrophota bacterium]